ncbi:Lactoylglutathione lyase [Irineochytrium annulatum]|nr:Lactoylglutathione lyase [Irineochytrium annulatum]
MPFNPVFNHTMIRVKDPAASKKFYCDLLGMTEIVSLPFEQSKFTLYFYAFNVPDNIKSASHDERRSYAFSVPGVLELTHNHGTENDPEFKGYSSGNTEPGKGFGHIGLAVDDVQGFCDHLESHGVAFKKKLNEGSMKNIAFALDPDGYWVEILPKGLPKQ